MHNAVDHVAKRVGARIRELRKGRAWTLETMVAGLPMNKSQLAKIEAGAPRPAPSLYEAIARRLGVTVGDLFDVSPSQRKSPGATSRDKRNEGRRGRV